MNSPSSRSCHPKTMLRSQSLAPANLTETQRERLDHPCSTSACSEKELSKRRVLSSSCTESWAGKKHVSLVMSSDVAVFQHSYTESKSQNESTDCCGVWCSNKVSSIHACTKNLVQMHMQHLSCVCQLLSTICGTKMPCTLHWQYDLNHILSNCQGLMFAHGVFTHPCIRA